MTELNPHLQHDHRYHLGRRAGFGTVEATYHCRGGHRVTVRIPGGLFAGPCQHRLKLHTSLE